MSSYRVSVIASANEVDGIFDKLVKLVQSTNLEPGQSVSASVETTDPKQVVAAVESALASGKRA